MTQGNEHQMDQLMGLIKALTHQVQGLTAKVDGDGAAKKPSAAQRPGRRRGAAVHEAEAESTAINLRSKKHPFEARVKVALEAKFLDTVGLARTLAEAPELVASSLKELQASGKVANVGSEDLPMWFWRPGTDIDHQGLIELIKRLISHIPLSASVILRATGATRRQVDAALVDIRRAEEIWDVGEGGRSKTYFIMPKYARNAKLDAKPVLRRKREG